MKNSEIQKEIKDLITPEYTLIHDLYNNFPVVEFVKTSTRESNVIYWRGKLFELRDLVSQNIADLTPIFNQYKYIKK